MSVQYDSDAHSPPLPTLAHGKEETLIDGSGEPSGSSGNNKPASPDHDMPPAKSFLNYEVPKAVASVRDGRQLSMLSSIIISALLTVVVMAFRTFIATNQQFQDDKPFLYQVMVTICYISILLNINATFGSFLLLRDLGEVGYEAAKLYTTRSLVEHFEVSGINPLLEKYGSNRLWTIMVIHWILTFYFGIVTFIMAFLAYIILTESLGTIVLMLFVVGLTFVPTSLFMFFRGLTAQKPKVFSTNS